MGRRGFQIPICVLQIQRFLKFTRKQPNRSATFLNFKFQWLFQTPPARSLLFVVSSVWIFRKLPLSKCRERLNFFCWWKVEESWNDERWKGRVFGDSSRFYVSLLRFLKGRKVVTFLSHRLLWPDRLKRKYISYWCHFRRLRPFSNIVNLIRLAS